MAADFHTALRRHNRRIGSVLQRVVQGFLFLVVAGPWVWTLIRILFRVKVQGGERLKAAPKHAIFAVRHFFEWDPLLTFFTAAWVYAWRRPHLIAQSIAAEFWTRTALRRVLSWFLGIMGYLPDEEPQGAVQHAANLLGRSAAGTIAIYPTGPIGRKSFFELFPWVGYLALAAPQVPVYPVNILGLQQITFGRLLRFQRPPLTIVIGEPFSALNYPEGNPSERIDAICDRIAEDWRNDS